MKNWKSLFKNYFMKLEFERLYVLEIINRFFEYYFYFEIDDIK